MEEMEEELGWHLLAEARLAPEGQCSGNASRADVKEGGCPSGTGDGGKAFSGLRGRLPCDGLPEC